MVKGSVINIIAVTQTIIVVPPLIIVIFSLLRFDSLRTRSFELVLMLMISNLLRFLHIYIDLHPTNGTTSCTIQGAFDEFFIMATTMWTILIAVTLDILVVQQRQGPSFLVCNIVAWSISILFTLLPLSTNQYGLAGDWCWIGLDKSYSGRHNPGSIWRNVYYSIQVFAATLVIAVLYVRVSTTIRRFLTLDESNERLLRLVRQLKWYPVVYIVTWVPEFVLRGIVQTTVTSAQRNDALRIANAALRGSFLQAIGNVAIYGCTGAVRKAWREKLKGLVRRSRALFAKPAAEAVENDLDPQVFNRFGPLQSPLHDQTRAASDPVAPSEPHDREASARTPETEMSPMHAQGANSDTAAGSSDDFRPCGLPVQSTEQTAQASVVQTGIPTVTR
jgi:hypothetical protein